MLEVLVAMLIISIGLVSLLNLQLINFRRTYSCYWQTVASVQAFSFLEVLRANQKNEVRQNELQSWNQQNAHLLPKGRGNYHCENEICTVNLNWQEQNFSITSRL